MARQRLNRMTNLTSPNKMEINEEVYKDLLERDIFLTYLESFGVDNWEAFEDAQAAYLTDKAKRPINL